MISKASYILLILLLVFSGSSRAGSTYNLWTADGTQVTYSVVRVEEDLVFKVRDQVVKRGDRLVFEDGSTVEFDHILGSGKNTIVFKVLDAQTAIRIPMSMESATLRMQTSYLGAFETLNQHIDSRFLAKPMNAPLTSRYAVTVELLDLSFTLDEFIRSPKTLRWSQSYMDLLEFLLAFRGLKSADDFFDFQIGYVKGRGWVLFDYGLPEKYEFYPEGGRVSTKDFLVPHLFYFENTYNLRVVRWLENDLKVKERSESPLWKFIGSCRSLLTGA